VLLGEGWVHSTRCGGSCSTHNPWPVHSRPSCSSGVGRFLLA